MLSGIDEIALVIVVANGLFDAGFVAWLAGKWSVRKNKAWLASPESEPYKEELGKRAAAQVAPQVDAIRTEFVAALRETKAAVEARVDSVGRDLRESLGTVARDVDTRAVGSREALAEQVRAVEERLGARLPSDLGGVLRAELDKLEARMNARLASEEASRMAELRRKMDEIRTNPSLRNDPRIQSVLSNLDESLVPKRYKKYIQMARAFGVLPGLHQPMPGPNGGPSMAGAAPPPGPGAFVPPDPNPKPAPLPPPQAENDAGVPSEPA